MEHKLIQYFSQISPLSANEKEALLNSMETKTCKKDCFLLKEEQLTSDSYFILEGCVREFKVVDGEEITTNFFTEEQWIISLNSFREKTASPHSLVCVEDTILVMGNEQKAQELFKTFPRFETISRVVMEAVFSEQLDSMTAYLTDSPEERYLKLQQARPALFQRVPQYQLASYIGVKPESLSRIRKRIAQQHKKES